MSNLIHSIKQLIARLLGRPTSVEDQKAQLVKGLMGALELTREDELGCDEVFDVIDQYAEAIIAGNDPQHLMPLVYHHMEMCGACREELEMLLDLLRFQAA